MTKRLAMVLVLLTVAAIAMRPYIVHAAGAISHPKPVWLIIAVLAELASMAAFAFLQLGLLKAGGVRVPARKMVALTYAANAVSVSLPAGSALSTGYTFKRLRGWGANIPLATFTLIASGVLSTLSFGVLALFAGAFAGARQGSPELILIGLPIAVLVVVALRRLLRNPEAVIHSIERMLVLVNRLLRREPLAGHDRVRGIINELRQIKPRRRDWAAGGAFAAINWLADLACLIACCHAVGIHSASITLAVVAYLAGTTASSVSLLPGGFGVVDTAMILTLSHGGLSAVTATSGVLLYRLVSVIFIVALGWVMWTAWWAIDRRKANRVTVDAMMLEALTPGAFQPSPMPLVAPAASADPEPRPERLAVMSSAASGPGPVNLQMLAATAAQSCIAHSALIAIPEGGHRPSATCRSARRHRPDRAGQRRSAHPQSRRRLG
ncbi:hypothetical protein SAMN05892883_1164 [Jatrophihabitans sp. GAS493]|uniref:lysylphosphatidylglycerol synthase transmembrane domain-containing protein n=1 Tax=Jatrophihabitans sp. GAS493 TaxID=1907575 RepID=UPI000BB8C11B|nr:YbhN family protein [Jatrophihabitans sp. GAS493]SOD71677.1 hypothetical protein SAMN05892883_1164 [Jatrophihabitans sp. GAS493]